MASCDEFQVTTRTAATWRRRAVVIPAASSAVLQQTLVVAAIVAGTDIAAGAGLGSFARIIYMVSGMAAGVFYIRRSPWLYLTLIWWFLTITPLVRRLIDEHTGFDPVNYILGTGNLMSLFMLKDIVTDRGLLRRPEALAGFLVFVAVLYGLVLSLVQGDVLPAVTATADWIMPLLSYFYVLANWRRIAACEAVLKAFIFCNTVVIVSYGLIQFFDPLTWDVSWVINAGMDTIGQPAPYGLRVFSTLNSPGALAPWLVALMLLSLHFRTKLTPLLYGPTFILLLITQVRSSLITLVICIVVFSVVGTRRTLRTILAVLLLSGTALIVVSSFDARMADSILTRVETLADLADDTSAQSRKDIYAGTLDIVAAHPLGLGLGATGHGALTSGDDSMVVVDSGPLAIFLSLGWIGGCMYLTGIALIIVQAVVAARATSSGAAMSAAMTAASVALLIPGANVTGLSAVLLWTFSAYAAAIQVVRRAEGHCEGSQSSLVAP